MNCQIRALLSKSCRTSEQSLTLPPAKSIINLDYKSWDGL